MEKQQIQRRQFLGAGAATIGTLFLPTVARSETKEEIPAAGLSAYVTESGHMLKGGLFLMGMLITKNQGAVHEKKFQQFRETYSYRSRLNYKDGDRYKVDFAKACIDYFASNKRIGFIAYYQKQTDPSDMAEEGKVNQSKKQIRRAKVRLVKKMVNATGLNINKIIVKSQSPYGPSAKFKKNFTDETSYVLDAKDVRFGDDLLQFASFLGGCIYGDIQQKTRNKTKLELTNYLKEQLGVTSFDQPSVTVGNKLVLVEI